MNVKLDVQYVNTVLALKNKVFFVQHDWRRSISFACREFWRDELVAGGIASSRYPSDASRHCTDRNKEDYPAKALRPLNFRLDLARPNPRFGSQLTDWREALADEWLVWRSEPRQEPSRGKPYRHHLPSDIESRDANIIQAY